MILLPFVGGFGLLIGSFLNVVIHRVPRGLSVVRPASACPGCDSAILARDNVPVVSWLMLRGACRTCGSRISIRYPVVEVVTGVAFVVAAIRFVPPVLAASTPVLAASAALELLAYCYLAAISVALAAIDIDLHRLPDAIVLPSYGVGFILLGGADLLGAGPTEFAVAAAAAGASVLLYFVLAVARPGGMGLGDVKLAGVLGLFLGQAGVGAAVVGTATAFLLGGVFGVALIVLRRADRTSGVPFGPWMVAGAWIGLVVGAPLWSAYLGLIGLT